jgi:hypothetical protein
MEGHFSVDRAAIKSILERELGLRKFTRRWISHILPAAQKLRRVMEAQSLLAIRAYLAKKNFQGIITEDEFWFTYLIESDAMFAFFPAEATASVWSLISSKTL